MPAHKMPCRHLAGRHLCQVGLARARLERLELLEQLDPLLLREATVNRDRRELALVQELVRSPAVCADCRRMPAHKMPCRHLAGRHLCQVGLASRTP
jgi:hypothetical protein